MSTQLPAWMQCDPKVGAIEDELFEQPDISQMQENLLPFCIYHIDRASLTGVDIKNGELIVIQGPEKQRKTTMALNLVRFWSKFGLPGGGRIMVETLESSMTRQKYKQTLVCMEATGYILAKYYGVEDGAVQFPSLRLSDRVVDMGKVYRDLSKELKLSVAYARTADRTPLQHQAIRYAVEEVNKWPLLIYGAPSKEGNTRAIKTNGGVNDFRSDLPYARWKHAIEHLGVRVILVDHVQGYAGPSGMSYMMLDEITDRISTIVAEEKVVVVAVSQVSLGSMRDSTLGLYARGGKRLAEEANVVFSTKYTDRDTFLTIETTASRGEPAPVITQSLDMYSGKFIGLSTVAGTGL